MKKHIARTSVLMMYLSTCYTGIGLHIIEILLYTCMCACLFLSIYATFFALIDADLYNVTIPEKNMIHERASPKDIIVFSVLLCDIM